MSEDHDRLISDLEWAADFDPKDPGHGFRWEDLSSDRISRRHLFRMAIAAGSLSYLSRFLAVQPVYAQAGAPGGELKAGWNLREFTTLDPAFMNQVEQLTVSSNVLGGLTHVDAGLVPRGDLAESWEVTPDGLVWTFRLRRGVRWHNGDAFSAEDVVYTYNRTRDPATGSLWRLLLDFIERVERLDPLSVRFVLKEPRASFLVKITERSTGRALTVVNRRAVEQLGREHARRPVGTGPFRISEHRFGERVVLDKFPDYYLRDLPKLDRVTIFNIEDPNTLVSGLESGQLDFINVVPDALFPRLQQNRDIRISEADDPGFQGVYFNLRKDKLQKIGKASLPTDDVRVRRAMAKGMDRDDLIKRAMFGRATPAYGPVNTAQKLFFRDLSATSAQRFDPEEARRLLAEAGYSKGFTMKMMVWPAIRRRGEVIADIWKRTLGISIELDVVDFPVAIQRGPTGEYELHHVGSGADLDPDDSIDDLFWTNARLNWFGYSNPQVDALNAAQREAVDLEKRKRYVNAVVDLIARDCPVVFLFHGFAGRDTVAFKKNVRGFVHIPGLRDLDSVTVR